MRYGATRYRSFMFNSQSTTAESIGVAFLSRFQSVQISYSRFSRKCVCVCVFLNLLLSTLETTKETPAPTPMTTTTISIEAFKQ